MSYVTSATILVSYHGGVTQELLEEDRFAPERGFTQGFRKVPWEALDGHTGGSKVMEADLYAAGFNYVGGGDIAEWFLSLPWGSGSAFLVWECNGEFFGSESVGWR